MSKNRQSWRQVKQEIYESEQDEEEHPQEEPQQGEVLSPSQEGQIVSRENPIEHSEGEGIYQYIKEDLYDDSSVDDEALLEAEKRKRQLRIKQREEEEQKMADFSEQDMLRKAMIDIERTNKRVSLMRKKNIKRMEDLEKVRMTQQPYLTSSNTHFRGSPGQYPLITTDRSGRTLYHPNYSLRVNDIRLSDFIQKNIREESTANYLNEVVKFQNYAYQQRKKRRQHME